MYIIIRKYSYIEFNLAGKVLILFGAFSVLTSLYSLLATHLITWETISLNFQDIYFSTSKLTIIVL